MEYWNDMWKKAAVIVPLKQEEKLMIDSGSCLGLFYVLVELRNVAPVCVRRSTN
jgi:hypothetical protein